MNWQKTLFTKSTLIVIGLIGLYFVSQWAVQTFQTPGHMGVIDAQSMDMTVNPPEGAMPVEVETLEEAPFDSAVSYTGSVVAYNDIPIYSRVDGWIVALSVYPGDHIKQGQVLAQLDTRELSARLQGVQFRQAKASQAIRSAKANLAYWRNKIERARVLVKEEVITKEEFDGERSQYETAESQYAQTLSEQKAASADASTQRIVKSYATITAPIAGVITERNLPKGALASPGTQILRLAQLDPIRVQAYVAQQDMEHINVGDAVRIWKTKDSTSNAVDATVSTIFPATDIKSRTAIVEAVIPNKHQRFVPGDYTRMMILTGRKEKALTVSNAALVTIDQQRAVWVMQNGKAELRYVTTGDTNGSRTEIINGLKPGEQVIVRGNETLQSGMAVVVASYGPDGLKALPKVVMSTRLDVSNAYKVSMPIKDLTLVLEWDRKPPKVGDNPITLRIAANPMGTMKMPVPQNLAVELTPLMPAMPTMSVPKPSVQKINAGRFKSNVNLIMPGLWALQVTVKQGDKTIASPTFEVDVPAS